MKLVAIFFLFLSISLQATAADSHFQIFGGKPVLSAKPLSLSEAVVGGHLNKLIRVEGKVSAVCQKKGCWIMLTDGKQSIRTTFKDYSFFVPKDILGKTVIAEGILSETVISEAEARHFAEDAGKSSEEIQRIVGDQKGFSLVARSVLVPRPEPSAQGK